MLSLFTLYTSLFMHLLVHLVKKVIAHYVQCRSRVEHMTITKLNLHWSVCESETYHVRVWPDCVQCGCDVKCVATNMIEFVALLWHADTLCAPFLANLYFDAGIFSLF